MIFEIYDAFRDAGAAEDKARRAAEANSGHQDRFDRLEHRIDLFDVKISSMVGTVKSGLELKIGRLDAELPVLKWMMGIVIALVSATLIKAFFH